MEAKLGKRYVGILTKMSIWEYEYSQGGFPTSGRMRIDYDKMSKWVASKENATAKWKKTGEVYYHTSPFNGKTYKNNHVIRVSDGVKEQENQLTGMAIACMLIYGEINELVKNMIVRKYGQALVDEIMLIKKDESIEISRTFKW